MIGYYIYFGANYISCSFKKQPIISRSSYKAEYRSIASIIAKIMSLTFLLRDIIIYLQQPPKPFSNNLSASHMIANSIFYAHSKHIEIDYYFVREKMVIALTTRFLSSIIQIIDIFTKPLPNQSFLTFKSKLGVHCLPSANLRGNNKEVNQS